jgi:hypothetical protein
MVAVVALAFTSCKKDNADAQSFKFNGATEQFVNTNEEGLERVYLDGTNTVQFEVGDKFVFFNITDPSGSTSQAATYELDPNMNLVKKGGQIAGQNGNYYAFYPGDNVVWEQTDLENENRAVFRLDATQYDRRDSIGNPMIPFTGEANVQKNALYMAAHDVTHTSLNDAFFDFKNICGMLSLKFYSTSGKTVTKIEITDKHFNLVGDVTLKIHEVDPVKMTTFFRNYDENNADYMSQLQTYINTVGYSVGGDHKSNMVTLNCGNGVQLGTTKAEATRFFIVMRPLALREGCTIKLYFSDGTDKTINSSKNNTISPNIIKNISAVKVD